MVCVLNMHHGDSMLRAKTPVASQLVVDFTGRTATYVNNHACRTESAHLHVVSGVSSCYAVKPSALHKTQRAMSPCGSLAQSHQLTMPTSSPSTRPTWAMRPPTFSSSLRENSARYDKACTHAAPAGNTTSPPPPPTRLDMVDVTDYLAVQPSGKGILEAWARRVGKEDHNLKRAVDFRHPL